MSVKRKFLNYVLGTIGLLAAGLVYMEIKHRLAEPAGVTCDSSTKCRGNSFLSSGMCLSDGDQSYCTHECANTGDCSSGMACEAVQGEWTEERGGGNHATQRITTQGTRLVCVMPGAPR